MSALLTIDDLERLARESGTAAIGEELMSAGIDKGAALKMASALLAVAHRSIHEEGTSPEKALASAIVSALLLGVLAGREAEARAARA